VPNSENRTLAKVFRLFECQISKSPKTIDTQAFLVITTLKNLIFQSKGTTLIFEVSDRSFFAPMSYRNEGVEELVKQTTRRA
jgi:hypothetical protein